MKITIDHHRAFPDVSIDRHVRDCQIRLAEELEPRKSIYLDLKFWIALREAGSGKTNDVSCQKLLQQLRDLVASGKVYCPINDSVFLEIFKQSDAATRKATTKLVDELSLGVSLIPSELRMNTEIAHFFHSAIAKDSVHPLQHLVWTKLSYVLGYIHPVCNAFCPAERLATQKAFLDHMWTISLSDMELSLGRGMCAPTPFKRSASKLNDANALHASELRSFAQTYQIELEGVLDLCTEAAAEIVCAMVETKTSKSAEPGSVGWADLKRGCFSLLLAAFKKEATKDALRSIHIMTCLHAGVRWDKTRMFKENDLMDFQHAAAAVGYCDAFFTERSLGTLIKRSDIALDKRYACNVGVTIDDAIAYLESSF